MCGQILQNVFEVGCVGTTEEQILFKLYKAG